MDLRGGWAVLAGWLLRGDGSTLGVVTRIPKGGRSSSYRKTTIPILPLVPSVPYRGKTGSPPRDQPRSIWHDINKPMARFGVQVPRRGSADQSGSAEAMMLLMGIIGKQKHRQTHNRGGPYPPEPTCATYRRSLMPLLDRLPRVFLVHRSPLHTWRRHPRSCLGRLTPSTSSGVLGSPILLLQGEEQQSRYYQH